MPDTEDRHTPVTPEEQQDRLADRDNNRPERFEDLEPWQAAHALVLEVFKQSAKIDDAYADNIAVPMEKAAIEVPRNIAEGFMRRGSRNKAHYCNLAQVALEGLKYYFALARDLKLGIDTGVLTADADEVSHMLDGLMRQISRMDGGSPERQGGQGGGGNGGGPGGGNRGGRGGRNRRGGRGGGRGPGRGDERGDGRGEPRGEGRGDNRGDNRGEGGADERGPRREADLTTSGDMSHSDA